MEEKMDEHSILELIRSYYIIKYFYENQSLLSDLIKCR
jgi:hypothetical protein